MRGGAGGLKGTALKSTALSIEVKLAKKTITSGIRELDAGGNKIAAKKIIYLILSA